MNPILIAMAVALGLSMLGNAALGRAYLNQRDAATTVKTQTVYVQAAAKECSQATEQLHKDAQQRHIDAAPAIAQADQAAKGHEARAQQILAAAPAEPSNDCKSADVAIDEWLRGRARP